MTFQALASGLVSWHRFAVMYIVGIYMAWWLPGAVQRMALLRGPCSSWICSRAMHHLGVALGAAVGAAPGLRIAGICTAGAYTVVKCLYLSRLWYADSRDGSFVIAAVQSLGALVRRLEGRYLHYVSRMGSRGGD